MAYLLSKVLKYDVGILSIHLCRYLSKPGLSRNISGSYNKYFPSFLSTRPQTEFSSTQNPTTISIKFRERNISECCSKNTRIAILFSDGAKYKNTK